MFLQTHDIKKTEKKLYGERLFYTDYYLVNKKKKYTR